MFQVPKHSFSIPETLQMSRVWVPQAASSGREGTTLELGDGAGRHWYFQDSSLGDHIPLLETGKI